MVSSNEASGAPAGWEPRRTRRQRQQRRRQQKQVKRQDKRPPSARRGSSARRLPSVHAGEPPPSDDAAGAPVRASRNSGGAAPVPVGRAHRPPAGARAGPAATRTNRRTNTAGSRSSICHLHALPLPCLNSRPLLCFCCWRWTWQRMPQRVALCHPWLSLGQCNTGFSWHPRPIWRANRALCSRRCQRS